jgi:hypothetical protein
LVFRDLNRVFFPRKMRQKIRIENQGNDKRFTLAPIYCGTTIFFTVAKVASKVVFVMLRVTYYSSEADSKPCRVRSQYLCVPGQRS